MTASQSFSSEQKFFDNRHFPRGFRRSGTFTINEADLLERHGQAMQALSNGSRAPLSEDEQHFVEFVQGKVEGCTPLERLWAKYLKASQGKRLITISGSPRGTNDDSDDSSNSDDLDD
ncbi:DUF413 domain-containing protein [Ferrimonas balearica]|uniref:DUF413 domain-containing protein n=1 Tax=Ferrimonas balearica TaxID=44012 RepID=UPI001F486A08|nr:DUF413 domain-containing protein [Ferrimonas balearica]MBY6018980.1 DUF413 domain-containing protein [Halomonas denitrificans]MBY6095582.1 DUF413 domain-containing protein [Ferrimonas balearica]